MSTDEAKIYTQVQTEEGWGIFETSRGEETERQMVNGRPYGHRPFELQKDDEAGMFDTDEAAWAHVAAKAKAGSIPHQSALNFLKENSPEEYRAIMEATA